jgi:hypothetical protein
MRRSAITVDCERMICVLLILSAGIAATEAVAQDLPVSSLKAEILRTYEAPEAVQAVAVDQTHFYAIASAAIGKYDRSTGQRVAQWKASDEISLTHLNSGVILDGRLYCAHSNYPRHPSTSSVEIFDTETLTHIGCQSFGIYEGSLTWVDQHEGDWWAVFAHYSRPAAGPNAATDTNRTSLVRFDSEWRRKAAWVFPETIIERFRPDSCSGGFWTPDGRLFCTGHDASELYELSIPRAGSTLQLRQIVPLRDVTGQGIAMWPDEPTVVWGINRPRRQVIVNMLPPAESQ